jgi:hypothetical protein
MSAFISSLPDWAMVAIVWGFLGGIMYSGYLVGLEAGMDRGHRTGFDLGKAVGRKQSAEQ